MTKTDCDCDGRNEAAEDRRGDELKEEANVQEPYDDAVEAHAHCYGGGDLLRSVAFPFKRLYDFGGCQTDQGCWASGEICRNGKSVLLRLVYDPTYLW